MPIFTYFHVEWQTLVELYAGSEIADNEKLTLSFRDPEDTPEKVPYLRDTDSPQKSVARTLIMVCVESFNVYIVFNLISNECNNP
jgi:hypothetical protein